MKNILQFLKDNNLFAVLAVAPILYLITMVIIAAAYGGGAGVIATVIMSAVVLVIFILLFALAILIDSIRKPNTTIPTLVLISVFCLLISFNQIYFIGLYAIALTTLYLINKSKNNYLFRYSGLVIILLTILLNLFTARQNSSFISKNIFKNTSGSHWEYCSDKDQSSCKMYDIPQIYKTINPLLKSSYEQKYICPYFEATTKDGEKIYIDKDNQQILQEFDTVEYIDKPAYIQNNVPINYDSYYFLVSKDGKYGLYEFNKLWCNENKLIIPCEYGHDDIQLYFGIPISSLQFIITKGKNGLYNLYARRHRTIQHLYKHDGNYEEYTSGYTLLYKNKKDIQILNNEPTPYTIKSYGESRDYAKSKPYERQLYDFTKVKINDKNYYIHFCNIEEPLDKNGTIYRSIKLKCK